MQWACARARKPREAYGLFQVMLEQGCELRLESYNALLCAYERTAQWEDAVRTFVWIQDKGLTPDVMSWSSLISACANAGQAERALEVLERMKASNCAPNVVSWCGLLKVYQKTGNWEKAEETFHAMLDSGCPPNEVLFSPIFWFFFVCCLGMHFATLNALSFLWLIWHESLSFNNGGSTVLWIRLENKS